MRPGLVRLGQPQARRAVVLLQDGEQAVAGEAVLRHGVGLPTDPNGAAHRRPDHREEKGRMPGPMRRVAVPDQVAPAYAPGHRLRAQKSDGSRSAVRLEPKQAVRGDGHGSPEPIR